MQPDAISVQEVVNNALSTLLKKEIVIVGAGRTDAGVHASQIFAHFDIDQILDTIEITNRLNAFLSDDVVIHEILRVKDDAHARFDAISRTYQYKIYLGRNPFFVDTTWQLYSQKLSIAKMNDAAEVLLDYIDFKCFSKSKTDVKTYNCKISKAVWQKSDNHLTFYITADRFLRNMVRAIVGTLVDVGLGKITKEDFIKIIESKDRTKAGFSVPAKGLFLTNVTYPKEIFI